MIEHIAKLLNGLDVQYVFEEEIVIIPYEDSDYISPTGNSNYIIFIFENPQGILNLVLPEIFVVNEDMPEMFHRLILSYTDQKALIKHRISEESNVDLYIQIPLLNQTCSEEQLEFALHTLTTSLTELYRAIQHLDEKGEINLDFLQMDDEVPLSTDEDTKDQASSTIENIDEHLLLTKEESLLLKNTGCSIGLFDAILLSENVGSFQQLTPLIDPSLSFQDLKRDSEGIGLLMQLLPIFNTTSLDKLFQYMKERIGELDVSLANKLSEEAKTRFTKIVANAKELDSKNNTPNPNNQSSKNDLHKEVKSEGVDSEEIEEKTQQKLSDLEISEQEEVDKEDKGQNKDKPNFDIL